MRRLLQAARSALFHSKIKSMSFKLRPQHYSVRANSTANLHLHHIILTEKKPKTSRTSWWRKYLLDAKSVYLSSISMRLDATRIWRHFMLPVLLLSCSFSTTFGRNEKPRLQITKFDFMPYNVNYFDESDILLFVDPLTNDLYRSSDAGESWSIPKDIPRGTAISLIMHPWEPMRAYIITEDRIHWMTFDRGESWRRFEVERFPSLYREALTFHAGDPDRIIWNGMDCSGIFCDEVVSSKGICYV